MVLLFMSPWIIGFLAFTLYPMVSSLYFSFTSYDLLSTPRWIGLENYRFMFTKDPLFWTAIKNTAWIIVIGVPVRIPAAIATASLLVRPTRGQGVPDVLLRSNPRPGGRRGARLPLPVQPGDRAREPDPRRDRHRGPTLWLFDAQWSKPTLVLLILWGVGDAMIIFLAGMLDVPVSSTKRQTSRERAAGRSSGGDPAHDLSGHLLLAGDRRDLRVPVLHTGVRDQLWQTGDAAQIGHPQNSLLFFTSTSTRWGSRTSRWGTPRRSHGCCSRSRWSARC